MFVVVDHIGRSLGLPGYRDRREARAVAHALGLVCGQPCRVQPVERY